MSDQPSTTAPDPGPTVKNLETIVSDRDIKRAQLIGHRGASDDELLVGDICPPTAHFADVYDPLDQVLEVMIDRQLDAIIVLKEGTPAGIFTDTDACRALVALLQEIYPENDDDDVAWYSRNETGKPWQWN